jgi:hypothetical protein
MMNPEVTKMLAEIDALYGAIEEAQKNKDTLAEWQAVYAVSRHYHGLAPEHVYNSYMHWLEANKIKAQADAELKRWIETGA